MFLLALRIRQEAEEVEFVEISARVELFRKRVVVVEKRMIGNRNCSGLYDVR